MNGPIYQLHPTSVIQIPVAPKEQNTPTANNIVVNNGYFINGAFIKLQQMLTQQQVSRPFALHSSLRIQNIALCEVPCSGNPFGRAPHTYKCTHVCCATHTHQQTSIHIYPMHILVSHFVCGTFAFSTVSSQHRPSPISSSACPRSRLDSLRSPVANCQPLATFWPTHKPSRPITMISASIS